MAQRQRQRGSRRTPAHARHKDNEGIVPVLARAVRELESAVQRGPLAPGQRVRFQVVALLVREHRTDVRASAELTDAQKADELKRLDGIATILAKTATRDPSLFGLLSEESQVTDTARDLRLEMLRKAGIEVAVEEPKPDDEAGPGLRERRVIPQSVVQHQLANPFLAPDFGIGRERRSTHGRLATWELLGPLFRSFELGGASSCMDLPEPTTLDAPGKLELMPHQAALIASAAEGHRTFLLADEPGLGKTAQALLAAQAVDAFPLLVVCPNVVKTNWARETERWTPRRRVDRDPRRRRPGRRVRRRHHRQLRDPRPARRLARHLRLPRHGGRRGPLHQEQDLAALAPRARALRAAAHAHGPPAADGADRHAADQRHRGLPRDLAVPRLDRRHASRWPA